MGTEQIIATLIFLLVMVAIISEKVNRCVASLLGSLLMILFKILPLESGLSHIDFNTIGVLIGMMLFVAVVKNSGLFEYIAIWTAKKTNGDPWKIMISFVFITAILSAFLDNVTTVLLIGPMTIVITSILKINPIPFLITQIIASNIGGTATLIGDPPNIMIGSAANLSFIDFLINLGPIVVILLLIMIICFKFLFKTLIGDPPNIMIGSAANLSFIDFLINLGPIVVILLLIMIICFKFLFKNTLTIDKNCARNILKLDEKKSIKDKSLLIKSIIVMAFILLGFMLHNKYTLTIDKNCARNILKLDEKKSIKDKSLLIKSIIVMAFILLGFMLHNKLNLDSCIIALTGATIMLLIGKQDIDEILSSVEWSTILFFTGLFVIVGGLEEVGLINKLATFLIDATDGHLVLTMLIILWLSAIVSSFLDNIPFVATLIPLILTMETQGLNIEPLWWAVSLGACLGGNGTLVGASANIVLASIGEKHGYPLSFKEYFKFGFPLMILSILISTVYLLVMF